MVDYIFLLCLWVDLKFKKLKYTIFFYLKFLISCNAFMRIMSTKCLIHLNLTVINLTIHICHVKN